MCFGVCFVCFLTQKKALVEARQAIVQGKSLICFFQFFVSSFVSVWVVFYVLHSNSGAVDVATEACDELAMLGHNMTDKVANIVVFVFFVFTDVF
jgi:hypothetical protein